MSTPRSLAHTFSTCLSASALFVSACVGSPVDELKADKGGACSASDKNLVVGRLHIKVDPRIPALIELVNATEGATAMSPLVETLDCPAVWVKLPLAWQRAEDKIEAAATPYFDPPPLVYRGESLTPSRCIERMIAKHRANTASAIAWAKSHQVADIPEDLGADETLHLSYNGIEADIVEMHSVVSPAAEDWRQDIKQSKFFATTFDLQDDWSTQWFLADYPAEIATYEPKFRNGFLDWWLAQGYTKTPAGVYSAINGDGILHSRWEPSRHLTYEERRDYPRDERGDLMWPGIWEMTPTGANEVMIASIHKAYKGHGFDYGTVSPPRSDEPFKARFFDVDGDCQLEFLGFGYTTGSGYEAIEARQFYKHETIRP